MECEQCTQHNKSNSIDVARPCLLDLNNVWPNPLHSIERECVQVLFRLFGKLPMLCYNVAMTILSFVFDIWSGICSHLPNQDCCAHDSGGHKKQFTHKELNRVYSDGCVAEANLTLELAYKHGCPWLLIDRMHIKTLRILCFVSTTMLLVLGALHKVTQHLLRDAINC